MTETKRKRRPLWRRPWVLGLLAVTGLTVWLMIPHPPIDPLPTRRAALDGLGEVEVPDALIGPTYHYSLRRTFGPPEEPVALKGTNPDFGMTRLVKPPPVVAFHFEHGAYTNIGGGRVVPTALSVRLFRETPDLAPEVHARAAGALARSAVWPRMWPDEIIDPADSARDFPREWIVLEDGVLYTPWVRSGMPEESAGQAWVAQEGPHVVVLLDTRALARADGAAIVRRALASLDPGAGLEAYFVALDVAEAAALDRAPRIAAASRVALAAAGGPPADSANPAGNDTWVALEWPDADGAPRFGVARIAGQALRTTDPEQAEIAWDNVRYQTVSAHDMGLLALMRDEEGLVREVRLHHGRPWPLPRQIDPGGMAWAVSNLAPPQAGKIDIWIVDIHDLRESRGFNPEAMTQALATFGDAARAAGLLDED